MIFLNSIERIQHMEECMNRIQDALLNDTEEEILSNPLLVQKLLELNQYMTSGQWLSDYELDEKGLLPETLKRGVLSQDSLYNLLSGFDNSFFNRKKKIKMRTEAEMLAVITSIAEHDPNIRAAYMEGSRINPNAPKDIFQDYDIEFIDTYLLLINHLDKSDALYLVYNISAMQIYINLNL